MIISVVYDCLPCKISIKSKEPSGFHGFITEIEHMFLFPLLGEVLEQMVWE